MCALVLTVSTTRLYETDSAFYASAVFSLVFYWYAIVLLVLSMVLTAVSSMKNRWYIHRYLVSIRT